VRCIGCKICVDTCPNGCLTMIGSDLVIDRQHCEACGVCVEACPSGARELLGRTMSVEGLLAELLKDRAFYEKSDGGVTLSGGEPTYQADFTEALLRSLKEQGISTALDTCGLTSPRIFDRLLPYTDLILFDLKLLDPGMHRKFTHVTNQQILENLAHIRKTIQQHPQRIELWIRTPLIPGATDTEENLSAIGHYLAEQMEGTVSRWELCAFNNLCRDQYTRLGLEWEYASTPLMTPTDLQYCEEIAKAAFIRPELVLATGATRPEKPLQE
jgi:pyruvate formate lyase activating enzyme